MILTQAQSSPSLSSSSSSIPCGTIVGTLTVTQIKSILLSTPGVPTVAASFGLYLVRHNIQARKICASCQDYYSIGDNDDEYQNYCGPNAYGNNATVSGLVIFPVDEQGELITGSLAGHIDAHQTLTESILQAPSETFDASNRHWLAFLAASSGKVSIRPDYLGYGESADFYKSFLLKPAYPTATLPLWQKAVQMVQDESNCQSYLKPVAYLTGYGEGAYAAVSIADALHQTLQVNIVKVSVGGGPYRLGSITLPRMLASMDNNEFPSSQQYLLAMLANAFSSTNPWPSNYGQGQDLLDATYRDEIVNLVQQGASPDAFQEALPSNPIDMIDTALATWIRNQTAVGNYMPCLTGPPLSTDFNALFCLALLRSDLTNLLHNSNYDIDFCHSRHDKVFHMDNMPDFDLNSRLTRQLASGSHENAYAYCAELAVREGLYTNVNLGPITECTRPTPTPTRAPATNAPTQTINPTNAAPITLPPTPKPTTQLVEAPLPNSAASATRTAGCMLGMVLFIRGLLL